MTSIAQQGFVILAGAGPGDEELITVKLQKKLEQAEVIITDRLVNPRIISRFANPQAEILFAGKQGYNQGSFSQEEVTALMIEQAGKGRKVLRLKGGDTGIFSNILDELEALVEAGIPYEIIPGVTAASGASAYTGIPLTARQHAQCVQFLTFNPNSQYSPDRWKQLANTKDTLVFYMASRNINGLTELMLRYSRQPATPIAVVEQATTPYQKVHTSTLESAARDFEGINFSSPSLVIIGQVVSLYSPFHWFNPVDPGHGSVFTEIGK